MDPMRFFAALFPMAFLIGICLWWLNAYPLWGIGVVTFAVPVVGVATWDLLMFIIFMENTVRSFRRKLSYEKKVKSFAAHTVTLLAATVAVLYSGWKWVMTVVLLGIVAVACTGIFVT